MPLEAVADVAVDAEDALDVHVALERRRDRAQLDLAVLGDGGDAGGEAAGQARRARTRPASRRCPRRRRSPGGRRRSVNSVLCFCSSPRPKKPSTVEWLCVPFTHSQRRPPLELGGLGRRGQRLAGAEQCFDVDAVVDLRVGYSHWLPPCTACRQFRQDRSCIAKNGMLLERRAEGKSCPAGSPAGKADFAAAGLGAMRRRACSALSLPPQTRRR